MMLIMEQARQKKIKKERKWKEKKNKKCRWKKITEDLMVNEDEDGDGR